MRGLRGEAGENYALADLNPRSHFRWGQTEDFRTLALPSQTTVSAFSVLGYDEITTVSCRCPNRVSRVLCRSS
jgi:hypothetical protein